MVRSLSAALLAVCLGVPAHASGRVFVVSKEQRVVQAFDADTGTREFEIKGTGDPHQVVLSRDGKLAYTADAKGLQNTISVIDVAKRAVVRTLNVKPAMGPHGMALTRDGSKLYVTSGPLRAVLEVRTSPLQVTRTFRFFSENVENVALTADDKFVLATSLNDGAVLVMNATTGEFERSILSGVGSEGLEVSPDGKELWVANRIDQTIAVIDIAARRKVQEIKCNGNPMHVYFTPDGNEVVVTCSAADRLVIIDPVKHSEVTRFEVGDFPVEMAFGEKGGPAFVSCANGDDVAVVDIAARKVLRRFPCGGDPEGIAYHSK